MAFRGQCFGVGVKECYNFAFGDSEFCYGCQMIKLKAVKTQAMALLEEALPHIECTDHFQNGLITAIGTFLEAEKE